MVREMLDHGDLEEIREMVNMWRGFKALGSLGWVIIKMCGLIAAIYGFYIAGASWFTALIKGMSQ